MLFKAFEPLALEREVIWYDQLGVGRSDRIDDASLLTVDRFLDELGAVIGGLSLERPHVHGHSWGAMLGLQYAAERAPEWTSLICANGLASVPRFEEEVRDLLAKLPGDVLDRTYGRELRGETDDPDYWVAQGEYMRVCRAHLFGEPRPGSHELDHVPDDDRSGGLPRDGSPQGLGHLRQA
ncbi:MULTISPECIES: alpha/beta fold hydrolase [Streptosporangium]|uniref:Proline-specific peptidase n=1 Tax=Streptosporangium brasiliense TaxID=47480 RepID=A0ABT9RHK2_9ACTN|nr:alpha/beta fold hydrolase [Streptosporangium brasiliense]MDP9868764.1 proline-specific peptidase [Streptosporangium brasiliense]